MIARGGLFSAALLIFGASAPGLAEDAHVDTCRAVLEERVKTCTDECIEKAKAAVDPEIRDRILGYGCRNNCMKLEMFNGHTCPRN